MLPDGIQRFDYDGVHRAPESPGVYAWYAQVTAGLADWRRVPDEEQQCDLGERNLRNLLLSHSRKFNPPAFDVTATTSFELEWKGQISPELAGSIDRRLSDPEEEGLDPEEKRRRQEIRRPFRSERARATLVKLLRHATPFFSAPIYIGTSHNLRERLLRHTQRINLFAEAIAREPEKRDLVVESIRSGRTDFAARVTAMGFAPEQLEVYVLDAKQVAEGEWTKDDLTALAAALEWLLNRWHRPIAGRI